MKIAESLSSFEFTTQVRQYTNDYRASVKNPYYVFIPNCGPMNGAKAEDYIQMLAPGSAVSNDALVQRLEAYDEDLNNILQNQHYMFIILSKLLQHHSIDWPFQHSMEDMIAFNADALEAKDASEETEDDGDVRKSIESFKSMSISPSTSPKAKRKESAGDVHAFAEHVWKRDSYDQVWFFFTLRSL